MEIALGASIVLGLAFLASVISVEVGISVAVIEIVAGVIAGNYLGLHSAQWMDFLAGFGGILLTFLAGAEVDPALIRKNLKASLLLGGISFLAPYLATVAYCYWAIHWSWQASLVAGCALSTTSLAVVYAVLVETGLTSTSLGKLIMAATFVTDMGTALALSLSFSSFSLHTLGFVVFSALIIVLAPKILPPIFERYGKKVIEPEIKLLFLILFLIMFLGEWGQSHAVLPVFVLGLCLARMFMRHKGLQVKLRTVAFAMITPFFFIKGGMNVSLPMLTQSWKLFLILLLLKTSAKFIGVWPFARRYMKGHAEYTTLLMSTGLTFGTISAYYGLREGYIDRAQFTVLVSVVIATAIIPTFIAQRWFSPVMPKRQRTDEVLARNEESE
jgi:Kef-type K+ transport system membrane component KefB